MVRLSLADIKKSVSRTGGGEAPRLTPYLLKPGELRDRLAALIALYEAQRDATRETFPDDRASELIGDYRLARCLTLCLGEWYSWRSLAWDEATTAGERAALAARDIGSPSQLRLALYDYVNAEAGGFVTGELRDDRLYAFARDLGIARAVLDELLTLDAEAQCFLRRETPAPPTPDDVARRYNQRAVEALLANASTVEWTAPPSVADGSGGGLGAVVKRALFLARQMGVQYEVAFEEEGNLYQHRAEAAQPRVAEQPGAYALDARFDSAPPDGAQSLDAAGRAVVITLFGPQELVGAPQQYGERLARLCRALLGYRRAPARDATHGRAALAGVGLRGVARVYLHGRPLLFTLDERVLRLIQREASEDGDALRGERSQPILFDSALERGLYEEFQALERSQAAQGWRLEREPEPILVGGVILAPDFALSRGARRVYLEIAGYWRPGYRERKARKLAALRGRAALIVAAPSAARAEFAPFEGDFPFLWYDDDHVSAQALLATLDQRYDDLAERLIALRRAAPAVRAELARRGRIPATEGLALLRCYARKELPRALATLTAATDEPPEAVRWLDSVGLCDADWLGAVGERLRARLRDAPGRRLALATLAERLRGEESALGELAEAGAEALAQAAGLAITRASIFEAQVGFPGDETSDETGASEGATAPEQAPPARRRPQPRPAATRTRSIRPQRSPAASIATPSLFGEDDAENPSEGAVTGHTN